MRYCIRQGKKSSELSAAECKMAEMVPIPPSRWKLDKGNEIRLTHPSAQGCKWESMEIAASPKEEEFLSKMKKDVMFWQSMKPWCLETALTIASSSIQCNQRRVRRQVVRHEFLQDIFYLAKYEWNVDIGFKNRGRSYAEAIFVQVGTGERGNMLWCRTGQKLWSGNLKIKTSV